MSLLIQLFNSNKKTNQMLVLFALYCLTLSLLRAKIAHSIYLFFLIWNLFLAGIPYAITSFLKLKHENKPLKSISYLVLVGWLLLLPNSFYIITDLVHIVRTDGRLFWLDMILVSSYSVLGFTAGIKSIYQFELLIKKGKSGQKATFLIPIICLLCGIGIYLGRILRFNSWDVITNPIDLFLTALNQVITIEAFQFSLLFGTFIYFTYLLKKSIYENY